ncbi:hypothetical protein HDU98_007180 [Podochytrium sp. JEL0797]|nr:hypothetical protein HDU98_007180 [Podochytrium sp. JEL0797]
MNIVLYFSCAWYFDKVLPTECGAKLRPWFLFTKEYWFPSIVDAETEFSENITPTNCSIEKSKKAYVSNVLKSMSSLTEISVSASEKSPVTLEIENLCKSFSTWPRKRQMAVDNVSLKLESGKLFALLGQSGAGKTTTTNILCGKTIQSSGSIRISLPGSSKGKVRLSELIGVCPQKDVLFDEMTAREHVYLYAAIKNADVKNEGMHVLRAVNLENVADDRVGTFSGGMKRRLSLTLSTIGNTRILFLDEPTTGLDPQNRKHVQQFIQTLKKDRIVILTTHSMEEADVLADEVGIMLTGRIVARGAPWELKKAFGKAEHGYRRVSIAVSGDGERVNRFTRDVLGLSPSIHLEDDSAGSLVFRVSGLSMMVDVKKIISYIENLDSEVVKAWGISQPNLEDVFINT